MYVFFNEMAHISRLLYSVLQTREVIPRVMDPFVLLLYSGFHKKTGTFCENLF